MPRITLYTKPGCHLCEMAEQVIAQVRQRRSFDLEIRDILDDPQAYQRYQHDIPVILLDGREIARHRLSAQELEQELEKALAG